MQKSPSGKSQVDAVLELAETTCLTYASPCPRALLPQLQCWARVSRPRPHDRPKVSRMPAEETCGQAFRRGLRPAPNWEGFALNWGSS